MRVLIPLLAVALLLTGCAGPRVADVPAPSTSASAAPARAADLVGGFWRVRDASGEAADTWVTFGAASGVLFRPQGRIDFAWEAQGDRVLTSRLGWSMSLGSRSKAPWLDAAAQAVPQEEGWQLLDADGAVVAGLVRDGSPAPADGYVTTPETASPDELARLEPAAPGAGVQDEPASAIEGVWRLPGADDVTLTLRDGAWSARTSCESGTGAAGGAGAYRVLADGLLLVTEQAVAAVGCARTQTVPPEGWRAVAGFGTARSFLVDGDRLTVFDRTGKTLGTLSR